MRLGILAFLSVFLFVSGASAQDMESRQQAPVVYKSFGDVIRANKSKHHSEMAPYMKGAKIPHMNQWDNDDWKPEYWIDDQGDVQSIIDGFYEADIIKQQYEDKVPVLEVGKGFLRLSPLEQRRVTEFVDYAFQITQSNDPGVYYVVIDGKEGQKILGIYTQNGLQVQ